MAPHSPYSDAFRAEALRRLAEDGISIAALAHELAVDVTTLRKWRKQAHRQQSHATRSSTPLTLEETQRALEQSSEIIKRQQMEIDILKKLWASSRGCPDDAPVYHHQCPATPLSAA